MPVEIPMSAVCLDPSTILVSPYSSTSADLSVLLQHGRCPDCSMSSYVSIHLRHGSPDSLFLTRTNAFFLAVLAVDDPQAPCTQAIRTVTVGACCSISVGSKGPSSCFLMMMHCCLLIVMLHYWCIQWESVSVHVLCWYICISDTVLLPTENGQVTRRRYRTTIHYRTGIVIC